MVSGPGWVARQEQLDRMLEPLGDLAIAAVAPAEGDRALDIGCGCGATTIELARHVGARGHVLGVDISEPMLSRARERCDALGLTNVDLVRGDAQQTPLPSDRDVAFSRFGVMFFEDPVAAFANIATAVRPRGRLGFVCWQDRSRNPWMGVPMAAALQHVPSPPPTPPEAPGPYAFADRDRVARILELAGFDSVTIDPVELDILVGGAATLDGAAEFAADSGSVRTLLAGVDDETRRRAAASIRAALAPYSGPEGVRVGCAAWIVSARR